MLNYIRAEFYKARRRKYTYTSILILLLLETLFAATFIFHNSHSDPNLHLFGEAIVFITIMGSVGSVFCIVAGDIVFAGQYKNSTLKNEVSFGLSRARIYLGKLAVMCLMSILYMAVAVGYYLALCAVTLPHGPIGELVINGEYIGNFDPLYVVGYFLGAAIPLWLAGQAVICACLFLLNSDMAASFLFVGIYMMLDTVVELMGLLIPGKAGDALLKVYQHMPGPMLATAKSVVGNWTFMGKAWLVGVVWFVFFTAIGLYGFNRKEIK